MDIEESYLEKSGGIVAAIIRNKLEREFLEGEVLCFYPLLFQCIIARIQ